MSDKTLFEALVIALSEMPDPIKNSNNPAFKRDGKVLRYADLEATLGACKPMLAANGIAVMQHPVSTADGVGVHTWLIGHGEKMDCGEFVLPLEGQTPQKAGGAITYARRYALTSLFGLAQEDDDANAASVRAAQAQKKSSEPAKVDEGTLIVIHNLRDQLGIDFNKYADQLEHYGVSIDTDLLQADAAKLINAYRKRIAQNEAAA